MAKYEYKCSRCEKVQTRILKIAQIDYPQVCDNESVTVAGTEFTEACKGALVRQEVALTGYTRYAWMP